MALIVLTSANGSPGVTTTALGLALAWPRPVVLIDADPTAAMSVPAGYLKGADIPPNMSTVDLALAHREGRLAEDLSQHLLELPDSDAKFLIGPARHTQARMLTSMWGPLADVLHDLSGQDVIVDAGRLGLEHSPMPLIAAADLCLLTARSTLPAVIGAHSWAAALHDIFDNQGATQALGLMLVTEPGEAYEPKLVGDALSIPLVATLPWDTRTARLLSHGETPPARPWWLRWRNTIGPDLTRALTATAESIRTRITTTSGITEEQPA